MDASPSGRYIENSASGETVRELFAEDRATIDGFGRGAASAQAVYAWLLRHPVTTAGAATKALDLSAPTVRAALGRLEGAAIVREVTGRDRDRVYVYTDYVDLLGAGTEPL